MAKDRAGEGWLSSKMKDPEFRKLFEREMFAEDFLARVEQAMKEQNVSKTELAKRMGCSVPNVSRAMRKTSNMTVATMVDMVLSLNLRLRSTIEEIPLCDRLFPPVFRNADREWQPRVVFALDTTSNPCSDKTESTQCGASAPPIVPVWSTFGEAEASHGDVAH